MYPSRLSLLLLCLAACGGSTTTLEPGSGPDATSEGSAQGDAARADGGGGTDGAANDGAGIDGGSIDAGTKDAGTKDTGAADVITADSGGGACKQGACALGLTCCADACVNEKNDPLNCGACGKRCDGANSMCLQGQCVAPTCAPSCSAAQSCCLVNGPGPTAPPRCVDGPTCPVGCPGCL